MKTERSFHQKMSCVVSWAKSFFLFCFPPIHPPKKQKKRRVKVLAQCLHEDCCLVGVGQSHKLSQPARCSGSLSHLLHSCSQHWAKESPAVTTWPPPKHSHAATVVLPPVCHSCLLIVLRQWLLCGSCKWEQLSLVDNPLKQSLDRPLWVRTITSGW